MPVINSNHFVENIDAQRVEINFQKTLMLIYMQKIMFISNFFFEIIVNIL